MVTRFRWSCTVLAIGALVCALGVSAALAVSMEESKKGLYGTVVDDSGNPVVGVTIALSQAKDMASPMRVKTTERGFVYPRLSGEVTNYYVRLESEEWYIKKYHIKVRRASGEIWQDDEGHLAPGFEDRLPVVKWRVGNATVEFVLAKLADFKAQQAAAARQGQVQKTVTLDQEVQELVATGDYKGAAAKVGASLETTPGDADRRWEHAVLLAKSGDIGPAIKEAQKALALKPDMKNVRTPLADWMTDQGQNDQAIVVLEKEREMDPENAGVYRGLTMLYDGAGRKDDARQAATKWAELAPDNAEALMAVAQAKAGAGDFAGAEQMYRKVAEKDPANAYKAFFNAGAAIWNRKGDLSAAVAAFQKSIELKADYPKSHLLLGYCLLNQGKLPEARQSFEKFIALAPNDPESAEIKKISAGLPKK